MLISKKELLAETGISYGQLYRWKREKLIPEDWFIKQSSFTGQETFFPKDLILNRVKSIQELKDEFSLEEIARLLSPEVVKAELPMLDLDKIEEIDKELLYGVKSNLGNMEGAYTEILLLIITSYMKQEFDIELEQSINLFLGMLPDVKNIKSTNYFINLFRINQLYYTLMYQEGSNIFIDKRIDILQNVSLDEVSQMFRIKYREYFNDSFFTKDDVKNKKERIFDNDKNDDVKETFTNHNRDKSSGTRSEQYADDEGIDIENISAEDVEVEDNNEYSQNTNEDNSKKKKENDKLVIKINNWEVRL